MTFSKLQIYSIKQKYKNRKNTTETKCRNQQKPNAEVKPKTKKHRCIESYRTTYSTLPQHFPLNGHGTHTPTQISTHTHELKYIHIYKCMYLLDVCICKS